MFQPIKWSSSGPSQRYTETQKAAHTNGIPYVCAAFCVSVYLCDGPDDDHLIG